LTHLQQVLPFKTSRASVTQTDSPRHVPAIPDASADTRRTLNMPIPPRASATERRTEQNRIIGDGRILTESVTSVASS
jgi:hypothetical protein